MHRSGARLAPLVALCACSRTPSTSPLVGLPASPVRGTIAIYCSCLVAFAQRPLSSSMVGLPGRAVTGTVAIHPTLPGARAPDCFLGSAPMWVGRPEPRRGGQGGAQPLSVGLARAFEAEGHPLVVRVGG